MLADQLSTLTEEELTDQLRLADKRHRQIELERAELVDELNRRKAYRTDGHASIHGLVRAITRCPTRESKELLRLGRLVREHTEIAKAMDAGELGVAQAHLLATARAHPRCGKHFDLIAKVLLDSAKNDKFSECERLVKRWICLADFDGANRRGEANHARRNAFINVTAEGHHGYFQGGVVDGEAMHEILERFTQVEWDKDWAWTKAEHGDAACAALMPRTDAQRRADALAAIFSAAVAVPAEAKTPDPVVNVLCDAVTLCKVLTLFFGIPVPAEAEAAAEQLVPFAQRRCESASGVPVPPVELVAALLAGHIRRVVVDAESVVTDMGRKQRFFTGNARIAAHMCQMRCIYPGCEVPAARCQTDHMLDWHKLGTTSPGNGPPVCAFHNLTKQNRGYRVNRDEHGRYHAWRPDGTEIT